ncbi:hypothetical protein Ddye_022849 [Dipteronia dyeriana]|uniref:RING-type domain-containing protein n=1 Tax=Dipteronia dyeriana TaxID=168575 RepID=A0AAD9WRT9_9ROSI|nr:hypothetical protein Ddye_022849 [Dipteronia dyeriana]
MTSSADKIDGDQLVNDLTNLSIPDKWDMQSKADTHEMGFGSHGGVCAICLDKIVLQETALVKGCEHAYWFVYSESLIFLLMVF